MNKLRKKAKLIIGDRVDIFFADEDDDAPLATAAALRANAALLVKAKMVPLPMGARCRDAAEIATDVAPTPFGSKALRVALCRPTPVLADAVYAKAVTDRGQAQADALANLVATLPDAPTIDGVLDGIPFSLQRGTDFFPDATQKFSSGGGTN